MNNNSNFLNQEIERINHISSKLSVKEIEHLTDKEIIDLCIPIKRRLAPYSFELKIEYFESRQHMFDIFEALLYRFAKVNNCEEKLSLSYLKRQKGPFVKVIQATLYVFGLSVKTKFDEMNGYIYKVLGKITGYRHDPVYGKALQLCSDVDTLSEGTLIRKYGIGYVRAHWIINELSENGYLDKEMNKLTYSRKVKHNKYQLVQ